MEMIKKLIVTTVLLGCLASQVSICSREDSGEEEIKEAMTAENELGEALLRAAQDGNEQGARELLARGALVDYKDTQGRTPLIWACYNGHTVIVDLLLQAGAEKDIQSSGGYTPLMNATINGHDKIVARLLKDKVSVNIQSDEGSTALMEAARKGFVGIINLLLDVGARVDIGDKNAGMTALMYAVKENQLDAMTALLRDGFIKKQINMPDKKGTFILISAALQGRFKACAFLLHKKADVNIQDRSGNTALMAAAAKDHVEIIELLCDTGVLDINKQNGTAMTALMQAACRGHISAVNTLLQHKAAIDTQDVQGWTALIVAARKGYIPVVRVLLESRARVDVRDRNDCGAIMYAADKGHLYIVQMLLDYGVRNSEDVDQFHRSAHSALVAAAKKGHTDIVLLLLYVYPEIDAVAALQWAVEGGHVGVVQMLIFAGVSCEIPDNTGATAWSIATAEMQEVIEQAEQERECSDSVYLVIACGTDNMVGESWGQQPRAVRQIVAEYATVLFSPIDRERREREEQEARARELACAQACTEDNDAAAVAWADQETKEATEKV